jgi:hypothetical protein
MANLSGFKPLNINQWQRFATEHREFKHYVTSVERPGALALLGAVEYNLFPPLTAANQNFHYNAVEWQRAAWNVFSVPKDHHKDVVDTAQALGMNIIPGPPTMIFLGKSALLFAAPLTASEVEIKMLLSRVLPSELVNAFSGVERFPGNANAIHHIENDDRLLTRPLDESEFQEIRERESRIIAAMSHGVRPSLKDLAAYVFGNNRVRPPAGPR